jgi:hypothetical protein
MSNGNITSLCEMAFQAYGRSIGLGVIDLNSILAGFDDAEVMTPRVVFNCDTADPEPNFDELVWACRLEIQCVSNCDDRTKDEHYTFANQVFSQFMIGRYTLPDLVTSAALSVGVGFFCQDVLIFQQTKAVQDRHWVSSLWFKVSCCSVGGLTVVQPPPTPEPEEEEHAIMGEGGESEAWLGEGGEAVLEE